MSSFNQVSPEKRRHDNQTISELSEEPSARTEVKAEYSSSKKQKLISLKRTK
jgi:hypothetical protein